jgi:hypothetical protein
MPSPWARDSSLPAVRRPHTSSATSASRSASSVPAQRRSEPISGQRDVERRVADGVDGAGTAGTGTRTVDCFTIVSVSGATVSTNRMALCGQTSTQAPQSLHRSADHVATPPSSEMAPLGHASTQVPQPVHNCSSIWITCSPPVSFPDGASHHKLSIRRQSRGASGADRRSSVPSIPPPPA